MFGEGPASGAWLLASVTIWATGPFPGDLKGESMTEEKTPCSVCGDVDPEDDGCGDGCPYPPELETAARYALPFRVRDSGGRELARVNRPLDAARLIAAWGKGCSVTYEAHPVNFSMSFADLPPFPPEPTAYELAAIERKMAEAIGELARAAAVVTAEENKKAPPIVTLRLKVEDFTPRLQGENPPPETVSAMLDMRGQTGIGAVELDEADRDGLAEYLLDGVMNLAQSQGLLRQPSEQFDFDLRARIEIEVRIFPDAFDPEVDEHASDPFTKLLHELTPRERLVVPVDEPEK